MSDIGIKTLMDYAIENSIPKVIYHDILRDIAELWRAKLEIRDLIS
jgi:hypothetical protein